MARFCLRVCWFAVVLLLWIPDAESHQNVTSIVTEAMYQISKTIRHASDAIQQHHGYVKSIHRKMQKMLQDVHDLTSELEPLRKITTAMDDRLANVKTMLLDDEERDESTHAETSVALQDIKNSIQVLTSVVENKTTSAMKESKNDFIEGRLNSTDLKLENLNNKIESLTNNFNEENIRNMCLRVIDVGPFAKHIAAAEQLLKRYEVNLDEYKGKSKNVREVARVEENFHDDVMNEIKRQGATIENIQNVLIKAEDVWKEMPKRSNLRDFATGTNQSVEVVIRAVDNLNENSQASMANVTRNLAELSDRIETINATAQQNVREAMIINIVLNDITRGLAKLLAELTSKDHKMTEIADDVKKNNKDIRNATSRIRALVSQAINNLDFSLNNTLKRRLDEIGNSMAQKQFSSNLNLESMVKDQMTQLWRQFGDINLKLKENTEALHKINVNNISSHTKEIGDNLGETLVKLDGATRELSRLIDPAVIGAKIDAEILKNLPAK